MEVKYWEGGLEEHEIKAIEKIKSAFSAPVGKTKQAKTLGSLKDLSALKVSPMHSWKAFAGFRFVDSKDKEGEFDLLIFTHCNILVVELKDWKHLPITSRGANWFHGNEDRGSSPVWITQRKKELLERKIKCLKNKITNKGHLPHVKHLVVITGSSDFSGISETDKAHTFSLGDFLKLADEKTFNARFRPHPNAKTLQQDMSRFEKLLFTGEKVEAKPFSINGWQSKELIFEHPNKVYREYQGISEASKKDEALIRRWDFSKLDSIASKTNDGRLRIVSRERDILQYIKTEKLDLYNHCLTSLTIPQKDKITEQYSEVYELPPEHKRFNEFVSRYGPNLNEGDRITLVKLLIGKFSDLHEIKVAHRDLGDHSIWISPGKQVALSNFISAYHQPIGTIGSEREGLSVNEGAAPVGMKVDDKTTPFQMDIYSLGLLAWHILQGRRLSKNSINTVFEDVAASDRWYAKAIQSALDGESYRYAKDFFDALIEGEPKAVKAMQFDLSEIEPYRQDIKLSREYEEESEPLVDTSSKEVYVSDNRLVKAWLNINPVSLTPGLGQKLHYFLERMEKLQAFSPPYIPNIQAFGIANKSSALFSVSEYIHGDAWDKVELDEESKWAVIHQLVAAVENFHHLTFSHGDLHPGNVFIRKSADGLKLYLIDTPDFCQDGDAPHNTRYSPENIDGCSNFERDNFAVMRMTVEMLGFEWEGESTDYPAIAAAVSAEIEDIEYGFNKLDRFKVALQAPELQDETDIDTVEIVLNSRDGFNALTLYPDNNQLYLQITPNKRSSSEAIVQFTGFGGSLKLFYSQYQQELISGLPPREQDGFGRRVRDEAQLVLPFAIKVVDGYHQDLSEINNRLKGNEAFQRAIANFFKVDSGTDNETKDGSTSYETLASDPDAEQLNISTQDLWQAIMDTELESHPYIEVNGDVFQPKDVTDQLVIPYKAEKDALDGFNRKDEIEAIQVVGEKEVRLGEVKLRASSMNEVWLAKLSNRARSISDGDIIFFRTKADKSSYDKRKNALERILKGESVIPGLVDLFDPACTKDPVDYEIKVTDEDFDRYKRKDDHGNTIRLNDKQRQAFQKLVSTGPLSMLQGPPGTGKTEFIAAFVHYLIEKQGVRNILLVSQSHEAVNTAAERIRNHCRRLDTPLELVRFSNNESKVSDGLKDVYSQSIITEKRELFKAEITYRIKALAQPLGLDQDYLAALVELELGLLTLLRSLENIRRQLIDTGREKDELQVLTQQAKQLEISINTQLNNYQDTSLEISTDLYGLMERLRSRLDDEYSIRPDESKKAKALLKISRDMIDVLGAERVNYDEFLARSRQLVAGTCVGIGQRHMGIADNQYDWVIIDEAARSIASELAIAMQAGKRVLLVGDHEQLPPLYSEPHKKALARQLGLASKNNDIDELIASDFERAFESAYGQQAGAQLLTQYRMDEPIGSLVSYCFYDEKLENGKRKIPDIYNNVPKALKSTITWVDTAKLGKQAYHRNDKGASIYSPAEADQIIVLLKDIADNTDFVDELSEQVKEGEPAIGVICMYAQQKRILRQKFKAINWSDSFKELVRIDTVDSYQGKENRIIILSITRSIADQSPGFLRSPNRINVALSRAMDRLVIVGNGDMWLGKNETLPLGRVKAYIDKRIDGVKFQRINAKLQGGNK